MYQKSEKSERLRAFIEKNCLLADVDISLSTGAQSSFYFDCKKATLSGESLPLIVDGVLTIINGLPEMPAAIGGLTIGADPIVAAVVAQAWPPIHGSIVRKEPKKHGTKNKIENQLPPGTKIVVIDDVITSGGSIKTACKELIDVGYIVVGIIALIDRKAGGKESLEREFAPVYTLFDKNDFPALRSSPEFKTVAEAA